MDWELIARAAYTAYGKTTDFKNFQGNPMPAWEGLTDTIRAAWIAASQAAAQYAIGATSLAVEQERVIKTRIDVSDPKNILGLLGSKVGKPDAP